MHLIVNIFGGPGAGKSTTAAGLFNLLKLNKYKTELVTEYAKDATWEQRHNTLENQFYITAKQHHRIWRVLKYYEDHNIKDSIIVTDSPIILGILYNKYFKHLEPLIINEFFNMTPFKIQNLNIFLNRVKEYDKHGRNQTEEEAKKIDNDIKDLLNFYGINYIKIDGDELASQKIFSIIKNSKNQ
jgi:nicotinamide riboside kinase